MHRVISLLLIFLKDNFSLRPSLPMLYLYNSFPLKQIIVLLSALSKI